MLNAEEVHHFVMIVEDMAGAETTVADCMARLKDEGLSDLEAQTIIRTYWAINGKDPFPDPVVPYKPQDGN